MKLNDDVEFISVTPRRVKTKEDISSIQQQFQEQQQVCIRIKDLDNQSYYYPSQLSTINSITPLHKQSIWDDYRKENQKLSESFFKAIKKQNLEFLSQLLKKHAIDINSYIYMDGWTLLHYACNENSKEIVQILIKNQANIEADTAMKRRPIHIAVIKNNLDIVRTLLSKNANVNCIDQDFYTPLHYSVSFGYLDITKQIISCNQEININLRNNQQMTAIECCKDNNILKLLMEKFKKYPQILSNDKERIQFENNLIVPRIRSDYIDKFLDSRADIKNNQQSNFQNRKSFNKKHTTIGSRFKGSFNKNFQKIVSHSIYNMKESLYESKIESVDDYDKLKKLGQGSYGKVFLVRRKRSSNKYALKCLLKRQIQKNNLYRYVYMERKVLINIKNPFIVHAHSFFQDSQCLYIVMQACLGGDLQNLIRKQGKLDEQLVKMYAAQIVVALGCLHKQSILFRDLKSANVLIDNDGHLKVVDFGLAKQALTSVSFLGSYAYLAPEMLSDNDQKHHGLAIDWYLLGVLIYQLLTTMPPFYNQNQAIFFKNISEKKPIIPKDISQQCKDILLKLLQKNPQNRLGNQGDMEEVKKHPWFNQIDWNKIQKKQLDVPKPKIDQSQLRRKMEFDEQDVYWQNQNEPRHFSGWNYYEDPKNNQ